MFVTARPSGPRGQQPGGLTRDATGGGNADHAGKLYGGTGNLAQPEHALPSQWLSGAGAPVTGKAPPWAASCSSLSGSPRTAPMMATAMVAPITGPRI
jgi:hypothetical protein